MASRYPEFDVSILRTFSINDRPSKVALDQLADPPDPDAAVADFFAGLPDSLAARDIRNVARTVAKARRNSRAVVWAMGAHVIKVGLSPVVIDLIERGTVTAVAVNGACAIHDSEMALWGRTSEEVETALADGSFGMARETHEFVNGAAKQAAELETGYGEALGKALQDAPYAAHSLFARAYRAGVPVTVHVALGTDIVHMHPTAGGSFIGEASMRDFRILVAAMESLTGGGVLFNVGSAVLLPEILLKAMAMLSNAGALRDFTGVNMDFVQLYRPTTQVVKRVRALGGEGVALTGHHEIMVPLLAAAIKTEERKPSNADGPRSRGKILRRMALARELAGRKARGERIVFTNGVFDMLHMGHIRYLQQARGLGDCLVVGVNTDASVRRIKGPNRPIHPELDRMRMLAALSSIDYVSPFEEDTPVEILRVLRPDIHVKGGDYDPETMPETPTVREYGGEVRVLPFLPGRSTTRLIEEIVDRYGLGGGALEPETTESEPDQGLDEKGIDREGSR